MERRVLRFVGEHTEGEGGGQGGCVVCRCLRHRHLPSILVLHFFQKFRTFTLPHERRPRLRNACDGEHLLAKAFEGVGLKGQKPFPAHLEACVCSRDRKIHSAPGNGDIGTYTVGWFTSFGNHPSDTSEPATFTRCKAQRGR